MLQKRFVNQQGGLWSYDARRAELGVRADSPSNLLLQGHLYTFVNPDGSKDISLEEDFSRLEGLADPLISRMVSSVTNGRLPTLTRGEREIWDDFFLQQWRRVPEVYDELVTPDAYRAAIEQAVNGFKALTSEEREKFLHPDKLSVGRSNLRVKNLQRYSPVLRDALSGRGLIFARIRNLKKSLVLASRPVVKVTSNEAKLLSDERVHVWLAISPSLAVSPGYRFERETIIDLTDWQVRLMNLAFCEQSNQIVGKSRELISSLAPYVGSYLRKSAGGKV